MLIPDNAELVARINAFVAHVDAIVVKHWEDMKFTFSPPPKHQIEYLSGKWGRINVLREDGTVDHVYGFICLQDGQTKALGTLKAGGIHKAATFKAPAKHSRGSVFAADFNNCATPHGIVYL